jgi:hypothetical protein
MSKVTETGQATEAPDVYETEICDDDYGFIVAADGSLKSVFLPDSVPFKAPKNVSRILKVFGIRDISQVDTGDDTLH